MKITKARLKDIIKEELQEAEQMTLNQSSVDVVLDLAKQVEPMFEAFRQSAGQTEAAGDPLYEQIEQILLELPFQLEDIAEKMREQGI